VAKDLQGLTVLSVDGPSVLAEDSRNLGKLQSAPIMHFRNSAMTVGETGDLFMNVTATIGAEAPTTVIAAGNCLEQRFNVVFSPT
jgi:hypothetical protein